MIQYPNRKKRTVSAIPSSSYAKRGMNLEEDLNLTNDYYRSLNLANVHKKPIPVQIVKVDYPSRNKAKIVEAYYKTPSTTDYNGVYRGRAIDFEAKETRSNTAFSLKNIHPHQIEHMRSVSYHGGIVFLIVRFVNLDECYLLFLEDYDRFVKEHARQSIPYQWFRDYGHLIPYSLTPPVHYLKVLDNCCF